MKSETKISVPRDASAVVLLNQDRTKVLWAQRNPNIKFLGGWHAFPGGKVEKTDGEIAVKNCEDESLEKFIVAAVRECFEEVGVLLVRNGEKLTKGQRASLHSDLISGVFTFAEILADWNLWIEARDFFYAGFWTTPPFSLLRFKTRFFFAVCPPKQTPHAAIDEMRNVEFVAPQTALKQWDKSEVLISPPVLIALQNLETESFDLQTISQKLLEKSQSSRGDIDFVELNSRTVCFPIKTETLPPATHTNCFIVGRKEFVVIDAAARDDAGQAKLFKLIDELIERGGVCRAIVISHLHRDHIGGERALRNYLLEKYAMRVHVYAHILSFEKLPGIVNENIEIALSDGDVFTLADENGESFDLQVLHTPGHARGHLAFYDEVFGFLLASDNVVGADSVIIAAPDGNMTDYLASLKRLKNLPNLNFLCGSHGAAIFDARGKIESYIARRLMREEEIIDAIEAGAQTVGEISANVYANVAPELRTLAQKNVEAHLEKLAAEGRIKI